jgi:hypothetical protein
MAVAVACKSDLSIMRRAVSPMLWFRASSLDYWLLCCIDGRQAYANATPEAPLHRHNHGPILRVKVEALDRRLFSAWIKSLERYRFPANSQYNAGERHEPFRLAAQFIKEPINVGLAGGNVKGFTLAPQPGDPITKVLRLNLISGGDIEQVDDDGFRLRRGERLHLILKFLTIRLRKLTRNLKCRNTAARSLFWDG